VRQARFNDYCLRLREDDDVAVARRRIPRGLRLRSDAFRLTALDRIEQGHKIAVSAVGRGAPVRKYGQVIGFASRIIHPGQHVHTHNLRMRDFGRHYDYAADARRPSPVPPARTRSFMGYLRPDGRAATRNYIAVISSVNCSASAAQCVRDRFRTPEFARDFPQVDGVIALTHKTGCCIQPGQPHELFERVLTGFARHPNIFGYVMIGLGCEGAQIGRIRATHRLHHVRDGQPAPTFLNIQEVGGLSSAVDAATKQVHRLVRQANRLRRSEQPLGKLVLAMNCGGSDGHSRITANPALGVASDQLVRHGGTSVLAETPEMYGAEHLLARRAVSHAVGRKLVRLIRWWENHVRLHKAKIDYNPTPGNKAGGLTTIYEKSLGALAKGGQSPLVAVYEYAQRIGHRGLVFMDTPGFDPVSMTGLVAGGCTIGCFTTGRGSVYGCKPSPCIKIATNTALYQRMGDDMDINAGTIMDQHETVEQVGGRIFERIIAVASGQKTKSEQQGVGDEEFAPWMLGPTL